MALDAAWTIAESEGYRGLTVRNIAEKIGYVPGTLYNVFDNLDDLVLQLRGETLNALERLVSEAMSSPGPPEAKVIAMARSYIGFVREHPKLWNVMFEHILPDGQDVPKWYHDKTSLLLRLVEDAIAPLFPSGRKENLQHHAHILWAGVHGICIVQLTDKVIVKDGSAEGMATSLISNYLNGLQAAAGLARQRNSRKAKKKAAASKKAR